MPALSKAPDAPVDAAAGAAAPATALPAIARRAPLWLVIAAVSLPMFMATLDNLVMTSALPVIRADLGASVSDLS